MIEVLEWRSLPILDRLMRQVGDADHVCITFTYAMNALKLYHQSLKLLGVKGYAKGNHTPFMVSDNTSEGVDITAIA